MCGVSRSQTQQKETTQAGTQRRSRLHCERAILSSSRPGELVVDFFGGSGSTLIACENTGRTCAMIELEPKWCDVIVRRYIKTTGDNNVRCVRQGRELPREEIAAIFEPDEEGGEQE